MLLRGSGIEMHGEAYVCVILVFSVPMGTSKFVNYLFFEGGSAPSRWGTGCY